MDNNDAGIYCLYDYNKLNVFEAEKRALLFRNPPQILDNNDHCKELRGFI